MIVSVFDPLAVLMLVAANWSLKHRKEEFQEEPKQTLEEWEQVWQPKSENPWADWDDSPKATADFDPRPEEKVEWPEDESRIETIGPNGNDGLHYDEVPKDWDPKFSNPIDKDYQDWLDSLEDNVVASPAPPTIEKEVDQLQSVGVTSKEIQFDYDIVDRRIVQRDIK